LKTTHIPIIGLDECYLNNNYGGQLLVIVVRGNDHLAYVLIQTKSKEILILFITFINCL